MLVNALQTIPLRDYIENYLKNYELTNYMTGETYTAYDVFNKDSCHWLKINPPSDFKAVPDIKFATRQKYFGDVYEERKTKPKPIRERIKVPIPTIYTQYIKKIKYKTVHVWQEIIKRRKIDGHYYWTTEFIRVPKRRKYTAIIPKFVELTEYKTVRRVIGYTPSELVKKLKYYYKFKYYIALFLFEKYMYKPRDIVVYNERIKSYVTEQDLSNMEMVHETYIEPFWADNQFALPFCKRDEETDKIIPTTPTQIHDGKELRNAYLYAKQALSEKKPEKQRDYLKKIWKNNGKDLNEQYEEYIGHYHYDVNVLDVIFFVDYDTRTDNLVIEDAQK